MKREAIGHTKMKRICRRLDIPTYQGVGLLESLWHLTAREAPRGDIGKLTDEDIALALDWRGDESKLIDALANAGWLDRNAEFRLVVHDWHEHADDAVNMKLARAHEFFCTGQKPTYTRIGGKERESIDLFYSASVPCTPTGAQSADPCAQKIELCAPPVPSPSLPSPSSSLAAKNGNHTNGAVKLNGSPESTVTRERFKAVWERHHKQNRNESTDLVFQMVISLGVDWDELEKKHIPYCAYWKKKGWNFCPLSLLQWIQNGMLGPPDEKPEEKPEPAHLRENWVDPFADEIAKEEPRPEPQRVAAQPHPISSRRRVQ